MNLLSSQFVLWFFSGVGLSFCFCLGLRWFFANRKRKEALAQANDVISAAEESAEQVLKELKLEIEEVNHAKHSEVDQQLAPRRQKLHARQSALGQKKSELQSQYQSRQEDLRKRTSQVDKEAHRLGQLQQGHNSIKEAFIEKKKEFQDRLFQKVKVEPEQILEEVKEKVKADARKRINQWTQSFEKEAQANIERDSRRILQTVINRFKRPYCAERGIGLVQFPNEKIMWRTVGPDKKYLKLLAEICGVDLSLNEENRLASALGFDPVRRELGRATLEKLMSEKHLDENRVKNLAAKTKKDLFKKIRQDGNSITRELGLEELHPEIKNMMGALRYRYSFAQNQHFHCAEVGWICGMLSAELQLDIKDGRRAGMLHDIGKAMDHSKDGGHAVIGADFIEKHDEPEHIVHAVRCHHYDETPATDLAFLVIAADAVSGARPGARRSTIDNYAQKMANLEKIANSFEGVIDTYILSAGREVRVAVDSSRINDLRSLELSKEIAKKIEEECNYPGLIKVTVVRQTQAVEMAK